MRLSHPRNLDSIARAVEADFAQVWQGNYPIGYSTDSERAALEPILRARLGPVWCARVRWQRDGTGRPADDRQQRLPL